MNKMHDILSLNRPTQKMFSFRKITRFRKLRRILFKLRIKKIERIVFEEMINMRLSYMNVLDDNLTVDFIVFSKDRAMQLHSLIETQKEMIINCNNIYVLYTTSSEIHEKSYTELIQMFSDITFVRERNFRNDLISIVSQSQSSKVVFLCDDGFFKAPINLWDITKYNPYLFCVSLARGLDATTNFGVVQELPKFIDDVIEDDNFLCWKWQDCHNSPDWSYPLSVGGVVFSRIEMLCLIKLIDFKGPNSLEGQLQSFKKMFLPRYGLCAKKSLIGYLPCNIISSESRCETTNTHSVDELLQLWNDGYRIKYEEMYYRDWDDIFYGKYDFVRRSLKEHV